VNRIDQIVTYRPLDVESFAAIVDHEIENLQNHIENRLGTRAFDLEVGIAARQWLLERGTSLEYGARELKRVMHRHLFQPLAAMVARNRVPADCVMRVELSKDARALAVRVAAANEAPLAEYPSVLLVQATRDPLRRLEQMMADANWEVALTETIRETKRMLTRNRPHAAVIDAELADGSGAELAHMLSQLIPGIPIIIWGECETSQFAVLPKPSKPALVMAALRSAFGQRAA
jgi:CheY-like chemotaxis protein